jgi:hypothetical protein
MNTINPSFQILLPEDRFAMLGRTFFEGKFMTTKYHTLQPFLGEILGCIRKDIKADYLPGSAAFYRTHFGSRPMSRLSGEEINAVFSRELLAGNEDLSEWVINRWVFKHGEIYRHFAERLAAVRADFDAIESLSLEESRKILAGAKDSFGAKPVYFFAMLNEVVFPEEIFIELRKDTEAEEARAKTEEKKASEQLELSNILERHEREIARLTDKYEQKLAGVLKKYTIDVEALKAQVRALQKR